MATRVAQLREREVLTIRQQCAMSSRSIHGLIGPDGLMSWPKWLYDRSSRTGKPLSFRQ